MPAIKKPNCSPMPNEVIDKHMRELSGSEFKVLALVARRTFGFHKDDPVAIGNEKISKTTGLSPNAARDAAKSLHEKGFVIRQTNYNSKTKRFDDYLYSLAVELEEGDDPLPQNLGDPPPAKIGVPPPPENGAPLPQNLGGNYYLKETLKETNPKDPPSPQNSLDPETGEEISPPPMKRKFNWGKRPKEEKPHGNSDRMRALREQSASDNINTVPEAADRGHAYNRTPPVVDSHSATQPVVESDYAHRWNSMVPSLPVNPIFYTGAARAYRSEGFSQQFDAICAKCEILLQSGKDWISFPFILKYDEDRAMFGWQKVMAGEYDRTRKFKSKNEEDVERMSARMRELYGDE